MADPLAEPDRTVQITSTDARFVVSSSAIGSNGPRSGTRSGC